MSLLFYVFCIHCKRNISFDESDCLQNYDGIIEEREDGVYMYSNGEWLCLDKKSDAEVTYVSPLNKDKIISDFNRGVRMASLKGKRR
jgi:hypothetical protein